ncbi:MAG: hypothetical protein HC923_05065 [Myxococcales bacterium]|nr:hypothetical protein [Myxococcales bacterium]
MAADVLHELAKRGGPVSPAGLGYFLRKLFANDPDVPEMDPSLEQAILDGAVSVDPASMKPRDLDETLKELDRLLAPTSSTSASLDMFELPLDVQRELAEISDMDPFMALTPIPDFVWDSKNDRDLLDRAEIEYRTAPPLRTSEEPARAPSRPPAATPSRDPSVDVDYLRQATKKPTATYAVVNARPDAGYGRPAGSEAATTSGAFDGGTTLTQTRPMESAEHPPAETTDPGGLVFWAGLGLGLLAGAGLGGATVAYLLGAF